MKKELSINISPPEKKVEYCKHCHQEIPQKSENIPIKGKLSDKRLPAGWYISEFGSPLVYKYDNEETITLFKYKTNNPIIDNVSYHMDTYIQILPGQTISFTV